MSIVLALAPDDNAVHSAFSALVVLPRLEAIALQVGGTDCGDLFQFDSNGSANFNHLMPINVGKLACNVVTSEGNAFEGTGSDNFLDTDFEVKIARFKRSRRSMIKGGIRRSGLAVKRSALTAVEPTKVGLPEYEDGTESEIPVRVQE